MVSYRVYLQALLLYLSIYLLGFNKFGFSTFHAFMHIIFKFISHISHGALFLLFYCLCFRSFGSEGMVVINFSISSLSLITPHFLLST